MKNKDVLNKDYFWFLRIPIVVLIDMVILWAPFAIPRILNWEIVGSWAHIPWIVSWIVIFIFTAVMNVAYYETSEKKRKAEVSITDKVVNSL